MKRILIVEDHKDSCLWISAVLQQSGYEVMAAGDALTAVHMAQDRVPDLVLLDLHLPEGGGEHVMDRLRRRSATAGIPIIIMTGDPLADQAGLFMLGAIEVFRKPVDVNDFLRGIREALHLPEDGHRGTPAAPPTAAVTDKAAGDPRADRGPSSESPEFLPA